MLIPTVIDKTQNGERSYDIYSRLLEDRIIFVGGEITSALSNTIIAQLLYLESKSKTKDVFLYINSPGGECQAGLSIIDTINLIKCPVSTIGIGMCASAAALLLASGQKGKRYILPNSKVMIHQPWGSAQGQITELEIYLNEGLKDRNTYANLLAQFCGKNKNEVLKDIERDNYMNSTEALTYGIVDKILCKTVKKEMWICLMLFALFVEKIKNQ